MVFDSNKKYIDVNEIKKIISGTINKNNFNDVIEFVNNISIKITEDEIKKYLDERLINEKPELKERIKKRKKNNVIMDSKEFMSEFIDDLQLYQYSFDSYTLEYFINYINILKIKINKLFNILNQISDKDNKEIFEILEDLDITINAQRKIKKEDAERLLNPILYNLSNFLKKAHEANQLETYYNYKLTKDSIYRDGLNENDLYPSEEIQIKNLFAQDDLQYIPLTDKQKENIRTKELEHYKCVISLVNKLQL